MVLTLSGISISNFVVQMYAPAKRSPPRHNSRAITLNGVTPKGVIARPSSLETCIGLLPPTEGEVTENPLKKLENDLVHVVYHVTLSQTRWHAESSRKACSRGTIAVSLHMELN